MPRQREDGLQPALRTIFQHQIPAMGMGYAAGYAQTESRARRIVAQAVIGLKDLLQLIGW